jgi:hypothetical protein
VKTIFPDFWKSDENEKQNHLAANFKAGMGNSFGFACHIRDKLVLSVKSPRGSVGH